MYQFSGGRSLICQPPAQSASAPKDTTKPAAVDNTVLVQPWFFGKARLVLTGGLTAGFLRKQEFQRATSIAGATVVGLKTDSIYRLTPMLFGHTLLYSKRHDPDAWYATFGVTSTADSKGPDAEFLLGLSRSLVQQKFFLTAGAYIGQRQKLDGGSAGRTGYSIDPDRRVAGYKKLSRRFWFRDLVRTGR